MSATEPIFVKHHSTAARTRDVIHHGAETSETTRLAENCEGEDLFEAASRTTAIEVASLDRAVPQSLRRAKATSSGSITGDETRACSQRAQEFAHESTRRKKKKEKREEEEERAR